MNTNNVANPFISPAILSLCTGMRGLERGIERAIGPVRTIAYVETEAFAVYNLVAKMEQGLLAPAIIHTNVKTIGGGIFRKKIHGVVGGYPCVGESVIGLQKGIYDERFLWPDFERIIEASQPVWGYFENVANHLNESFPYVLNSLRNMGYAVEAGIFSAAEVGGNHIRERLFIMAIKNEFLLHAKRKGLERLTGHDSTKEGRSQSGRSTSQTSIFPAFRGNKQYEWEESRIESRLGFTVHGYNYTEDLLRMAGNGVVEQTAELAFITLLKKHGIEI